MNKEFPKYVQVQPGAAMPADTHNKWYCVYFEQSAGRSFARYMGPNGWQKTCYYWMEKREAQLAWGQHGWKSLPVTQQEITDQRMMEEDCRAMDRFDDSDAFIDYDDYFQESF